MSNNSEKQGLHKIVINWYPGHMAKTKRLIKENIDKIDIVYEVIDSRIPYSSKIKDVKEYIKNKPSILVMTKKDLCDISETKKWISYYESLGYKVILLDLTQNSDLKKLVNITEKIIEPINQKRKEKGMIKRKTRVLVIGVPNSGKSTLINRLVQKKIANVGNKPGITKQLNWIRINEYLELLDTPGVLWPKLEEEEVAFNLASLTAIKEEILPIYDVAKYILKKLFKYYPEILKERYNLEEVSDFTNALEIIGKRRGCLIKGGEVDYDKVVNIIINDIKEGYIKNITFDRFEDKNDK